MLISTIIPIYNGEKYIEQLFECFRKQEKFEGSVELIFVNDGSTDQSSIILDQSARNIPNNMGTVIINQPNLGVSEARNAGIEVANGDYITFIDIDDTISTNYYYVLFSIVNAYPETEILIYEQNRIVKNDKREISSSDYFNVYPVAINNLAVLKLLLSNPTRYGIYNILIKTNLILNNNIRLTKGYQYYEDYDFMFRVFAIAKNIISVNIPLYNYILRENSAMTKFDKKRFDCLVLMKKLEKWIKIYQPEFYPSFKKWMIPRLMWSVTWQLALAVNSYGEFKKFIHENNITSYIKNMYDYNNNKVRITSYLFCNCMPLYYCVVKLLGKKKTKIISSNLDNLGLNNYIIPPNL